MRETGPFAIAPGTVSGPHRVVRVDCQWIRLPQGVEDLAVEQLVPEAGVEAFYVAVLPRRAELDLGGLSPDGSDPVAHGLGNELRVIG